MTDKEVLYISTIAQLGSVTKAAEQLFVAQPSLTQALQRIESDYGVSFFTRSKSGLRLTEMGGCYLEAARRMSNTYERMKNEMGLLADEGDQLDLGITSFLGSIFLPQYIKRFKAAFPGASLRLLESSSTKLEELADTGKIDYAVLHTPLQRGSLKTLSLLRERFLLAVPPDDADYLSAASTDDPIPEISKEVLMKKSLIMLLSTQRNRQVADLICTAAGVIPQIGMTTTSFLTAMALTEQGIGAAFVPESYARYYQRIHKVRYFRFPEEWHSQWELVVAYSREHELSKLALRSVLLLQSCIADMQEVFRT